jgi:hypothetical protein
MKAMEAGVSILDDLNAQFSLGNSNMYNFNQKPTHPHQRPGKDRTEKLMEDTEEALEVATLLIVVLSLECHYYTDNLYMLLHDVIT